MAGKKASLRASDFVDALPMPVDGKFEWANCGFVLFDYTRKTGEKVATTTAAHITFKGEDGTEYEQHYSVGDPARVLPSQDGKAIILQGDNANLNKSSNFFVLMNALESAGLPEDFMGEDISVLDGMVTHNIGVPETTRAGLAGSAPAVAGAAKRTRILPVPDEIISMPGKKGKGAAGAKKGAGAKAPEAEDLVPEAMAMVSELLEANPDGVERKTLAAHAIKAKRGPVATLAFKLTEEQLSEYGYALDGNKIVSAGG